MDISVRTKPARDAVLVEVTGELDLFTAPMLREQLMQLAELDPGKRVLLDVNGVGFIDSTGLSAIVGAHRRLTRGGGSLELICEAGAVQRLLTITRLNQVFLVHPRIPAGIAG